jgi:hypothetical protein
MKYSRGIQSTGDNVLTAPNSLFQLVSSKEHERDFRFVTKIQFSQEEIK